MGFQAAEAEPIVVDQIEISAFFGQAAYQYFSSAAFYVQGLAPRLPMAVLYIYIANGVQW